MPENNTTVSVETLSARLAGLIANRDSRQTQGAEPLMIGSSDLDLAVHVDAPETAALQSLGVFWLSGLRSSMNGEKASSVAAWCAESGRTAIRFDYRGHGDSPGEFEDCVVSDWLTDSLAVFDRYAMGPQILVGSSLGGWLACHVAEARGSRDKAWVAGLVLIAPAIDMTERLIWQAMPEATRTVLLRDGIFMRPSRYGDGDYPITRALIEDGKQHLFGDRPLDFDGPIHIVHGGHDVDVPWTVSRDFCSNLARCDVRFTLIPDGEHRLSRPSDIAIILHTIETMADQLSAAPDAQSTPNPSR